MTCLTSSPPAPTATPFCTGDEFPKALSWPTNVVRYSANEAGSDDFPGADGTISPQLLDAVTTSFDTWNEPDCSNFEFVFDGLTPLKSFDRDDGVNLVVFRSDDWPYGDMAVAVTTVTAKADGEIINADVELNDVMHEFAIIENGGGGGEAWDVGNTITHEAGHVLGLDHDAVPDSTMEFEAQPGETKKRELHPDDIEGLCTIYPVGEDLEPAEPPADEKNGCCRTVAHPPLSPLLLLALVILIAAREAQAARKT